MHTIKAILKNQIGREAIRKLLKAVFDDQRFTIFCFDLFPVAYQHLGAGMTLAEKIQALLACIKGQDDLDRLLALVEEVAPEQYAEFKASLTRHNADVKSPRSRLEITLPGSLFHLSSDGQQAEAEALVKAIASITNLAHDQIRFSSLTLQLEMPTEAADELIDLDTANAPVIRELGIQQIKLTYRQDRKMGETIVEAISHAREATDRFAAQQIQEPDWEVKAWIEEGCALRDWALSGQIEPELLILAVGNDQAGLEAKTYTLDELYNLSEHAFQRALTAAGSIYDLRVQALLNLARLRYHRALNGQLEALDQVIPYLKTELFPQIEATILEHYRQQAQIETLSEVFRVEEKDLFLVYLGRLEWLRAEVAFRRFRLTQDADDLQQAARHYALSLAYNRLFSPREFQEARLTRQSLYDNFRRLNTDEMNVVQKAVAQVEDEYNLAESIMSRILREEFGVEAPIVLAEF